MLAQGKAEASTFVEVYSLARADIESVLCMYPEELAAMQLDVVGTQIHRKRNSLQEAQMTITRQRNRAIIEHEKAHWIVRMCRSNDSKFALRWDALVAACILYSVFSVSTHIV